MGVMSCSRNSCENIMCNIYVHSLGYVCNECATEFKEYMKTKNICEDEKLSESAFNSNLKLFLRTEKGSFDESSQKTIDEHFEMNTRP